MEALNIVVTPPKTDIVNIDELRLFEKGYLVTSNDKSAFNEQYRQIKRAVIDQAFGSTKKKENSNLVMVTSANKKEGKTFVAVNLALSSALEKNKTVLLIDANVINPTIHNEFDFESKNGLIEYLLGEIDDLSEVIYNTSIDNLKIIPAGKPHYLTNELLASDLMKKLTRELATRYPDRLVIFDAPEINNVAETSILSSQVGQVVFVAQANKTKLSSAKQACERLPEDTDVGIVINKRIR